MGREQLYKYTCDLCKAETYSQKNPDGWVGISVMYVYGGEDYYDKVICEKCVEKIKKVWGATPVRKKVNERGEGDGR